MTATAPVTATKKLTYEEYMEEFRTQPPSRQPCEIIDGEVFMPPSPRRKHQHFVHNLDVILDSFTGGDEPIVVYPSPLDVLIRRAPLRVRQPDLIVMSESRSVAAGGIDADGPLDVAPELVIEVLSPSETQQTIANKIADFQSIGVQECWIVSSDTESVEVLKLTADAHRTIARYGRDEIAKSEVFPAIQIPVAKIFAR